ncbi:MAG: site-2 protease family protein, partial [Gemmataceae bacterium]
MEVKPESVKPETPSTPPATPPASWIARNLTNLVIGAVGLFVVCYLLNPLDVMLAAAGLTLIIFLHELGHFAAAKFCGVRVETFSIGFGPALPFCSFQYGETTYKLAMIPLGGYVKMLGEGDGTADEDAESDPRSFKNQSVPERMLIISAGVIMNLILGATLFVIVYTHGLEEQPAIMQTMEPGGAAWREGMHSGTQITKIGSRTSPWFEDLRPIVWSTSKGERVPIETSYAGQITSSTIEPLKDEGQLDPVLGILPPRKLELFEVKGSPQAVPPLRAGSAASRASVPFQPGDRIVGMSDPAKPDLAVTALTPGPGDLPSETLVYHKRLALLAGKPVTFHILRKTDAPDAKPTE